MKKIILLLAFSVTGLVSAKTVVLKNENIDPSKGISTNKENVTQESNSLPVNKTTLADVDAGECYQRKCQIVSTEEQDGSTTEYKACSDWERVECPEVK